MPFQPVKRLKVAPQVAHAIRDAILQGQFRPGESLPSERHLAEEFGVNRSSVREAIHRLEAWGLVESRQGGGTRVREYLRSAGISVLPFLLAPGGILDPALLADLLELRGMILEWTAARAARQPGDLSEAREALDRLESASDPAARQRADFDFYEALTRLTGNQVLELLSASVGRVYLENRELFEALYQRPVDTGPHGRTLAAIEAGDAEAAAAAMAEYARRAPGHG